MTKTVPQITAEADEAIWALLEPLLVEGIKQNRIASRVDVSQAWLSRYLSKNVGRIKSHPEIPRYSYCRQKRRY